MSDVTANLKLPLLFVGQAKKEVTHNEALTQLDAVLSPTLLGELADPPTSLEEADAGSRWLVEDAATGIWSGHDGKMAVWTGSGWRFFFLPDAFRAYRADLGHYVVRIDGNWITIPTIEGPDGGSVVDTEARATLLSILTFLRMTGQIADDE